MSRPLILLGFLSLAACGGPFPRLDDETSIPFVSTDGILEWRAGGDDTLFIRGHNGDWFKVRTLGSCSRLKTALRLGFQTTAGDQLQRGDAILAEGKRCPVSSVQRIAPLPPKRKQPR